MGKLIVIEGADGSGKTVQSELLLNYFKKQNIFVKYYNFPRYHTFYGQTIAKYLRGDFGDINEVSPYLASLPYALDRLSAKDEINQALNKGQIIITNRYATSSLAHQAAKLKSVEEKKNFTEWLYELEYKIHKIPKEDLVIYLYVPWEISLTLTSMKEERRYLQGKQDIQERNHTHRQEVEKMYLSLANSNQHWIKIDCTQDSKLLSPQEIHEQIIETLKPRLRQFDI